ncbi:hypothetical protein K402DRAFT_418955 [Aulographum hederae CBS 113979]|uniref:Rad21/Rec8-like protein N-terminal domain-containing protein n=1 Tax=Aulographum hederae CBS 113979 TaxID=1176131 RepID=A0A6G1H7G6_9PEZI|nr:hypothetical protein K402DRAFT_418955 [Aulographum hederae CBS 113979]
MFYSHEVLTSRKYGVATIWLVATLGSKSGLKKAKVNRKAILEVNVPKACETIITPEAPMALRLQSNLLFGVSRVFEQQCGFVLTDAQNAQKSMRALLEVVRYAELDTEAGRTQPEQLLLQDDPAFLPDDLQRLGKLNLDILDEEAALSLGRSSQMSGTLSPMTPYGSQDGSVGGLIIPTSDTGDVGAFGGFNLLGDDVFGTSASRPKGDLFAHEEDDGFLPEVDFDFDADGNMIQLDAPAETLAGTGLLRHRTGSDPNAPARVSQEHEGGQTATAGVGEEMDLDLPAMDEYDLPEGSAFPSVGHGGAHRSSPSAQFPDNSSSTLDHAPPRQNARGPRVIPLDQTMELRNSDLVQWNASYLANMAEASRHKLNHKAPWQAKKNAEYWVLGAGLNGAGKGLQNLKSPLDMFIGENLLDTLGLSLSSSVAGRKRGHESDEETDDQPPRKRARSSFEDNVGRGMDDDGLMNYQDEDVELPREAPEGLEDFSAMPWNVYSASVRGSSVAHGPALSVAGFPTSAGGPSSFAGVPGSLGVLPGSRSRRGSRLVSASPLVGRGRPSALHDLHSEDEGEGMAHGDDHFGQVTEEEFELYGPTAAVDTQTAAESQLPRDALDSESFNFLAFIEHKIGEQNQAQTEDGEGEVDSITFETLLPPQHNSQVVAAQGLLHVLSLASKNLISADQDEAFGDITMTVVSTEA